MSHPTDVWLAPLQPRGLEFVRAHVSLPGPTGHTRLCCRWAGMQLVGRGHSGDLDSPRSATREPGRDARAGLQLCYPRAMLGAGPNLSHKLPLARLLSGPRMTRNESFCPRCHGNVFPEPLWGHRRHGETHVLHAQEAGGNCPGSRGWRQTEAWRGARARPGRLEPAAGGTGQLPRLQSWQACKEAGSSLWPQTQPLKPRLGAAGDTGAAPVPGPGGPGHRQLYRMQLWEQGGSWGCGHRQGPLCPPEAQDHGHLPREDRLEAAVPDRKHFPGDWDSS